MIFYNRNGSAVRKICTAAAIMFAVSCIKLCAETLSPEQAKTYRENFISEAKKHIGAPYVLGATGPDSFDCSGLIYYCAREATKIQLPRTAKAIYSYVKKVPDKKMEPGDLVFFSSSSGGSISHVGIYIGHKQFISAISDGQNTGVIVSSLNQTYWKPRYAGAGQFIRSAKEDEEVEEEIFADDNETASSGSNNTGGENVSYARTNRRSFNSIILDADILGSWSPLDIVSSGINLRGLDFRTNIRLKAMGIEPGIGVGFRWNKWLDVYQIPIMLSFTPTEYCRLYAGPIFTLGNQTISYNDKELKPSIFPGIFGFSLSTPEFRIARAGVQLVQDISWTVFNNSDGSQMSLWETSEISLVMHTGIRISLPMSAFF